MNHWVLGIGWLIAAFGIAHNWHQMLIGLTDAGRAEKHYLRLGWFPLFRRENFTESGWRHRNLALCWPHSGWFSDWSG